MEFFHFRNGLCYNWQEAITLNSFHIIPFYWVVWSLFSIKDLEEFRNGFFFCPAISFSCRALGGYFSRMPILLLITAAKNMLTACQKSLLILLNKLSKC